MAIVPRPLRPAGALFRRAGDTDIRPVHAAILLGAACYAGALLGFELAFVPRPVTLWFPNAILLAGLLLAARPYWWLLLTAAFAAHLLALLPRGVPAPVAVLWFVSNATQAVIAAVLVRHRTTEGLRLDRLPHVTVFVAAALFAIFLSSLLGAALIDMTGWGTSSLSTMWRRRFFSDVLGALTVVPVIIGLTSVRRAALREAPAVRYMEGGVLAVAVLTVSVIAFGSQVPGPQTITALVYAPLPLLLWAVVRFGPVASSSAVLAAAVVAMWNASHGRGPFVLQSPEANALEIQLLFSLVAATLMTLAAVLEERKDAQAAEIRNREQLGLALDAARMTFWDVTLPDDTGPAGEGDQPRHERRGSNDGALPLEQIVGRVHPSDLARVSKTLTWSIKNGGPLDMELRIIEPSGDIRWIHSMGRVVRDESGGPTRLIGLSADITARRMAEALNVGASRILELIATGAPLKHVLIRIVELIEAESLGLTCSVLVMDDATRVRHVAAPNLPEEFVREIERLEMNPTRGSCGAAMHQRRSVVTADISTDFLWDGLRDEALRHGLRGCWSTPIISEHGAVLGTFAMFYGQPREPTEREVQLVDIATQLAAIALERRRADVEATEQRRAITHLGRVAVIGELSGALAHELSQPLTVILSEAQAARRLIADTPGDPRLSDVLEDIIDADRRAGAVLDRLRGLMLKQRPRFADLSLNDAVIETLRLAHGELTAREVMVTTRLTPGLPPVHGDTVQLQQVLLNLCMNACDAMSSNAQESRAMTFTTLGAPDRSSVQLALTDYGTGIPDDILDRIFDPFFTSKERGLGLGLSICRSIILEHRGTLTARNNPGGGATLILALPAAEHARALARAEGSLLQRRNARVVRRSNSTRAQIP
ncbi:MAG TPA: MASE1 domain-containing protein [Longimicrobiales bacterium]|nr:MASE1 domain-containing protein [Longimicrobiales bacterium]